MKKLTLILSICASCSSFAADTLTFGVVPQQSASRLVEQWGPVMDYLSEQTGQKIEFSTAADIPTFEKRLANGEYDIAYMNPYHYTVFSAKPGYQAMAKAKDKRIKGILVVRKDQNIESLQQLDSQKLAFPSPAAFAATILTQSDLNQAGVDFEADYVSSHDSVYLSVAKGFYPAGGGVMRTFNSIPSELREQLKPLWITKPYTPHAIAYHPRLSASQAKVIRQALTNLENNASGQTQLKKLNIKGFVDANDSDWDDVRALDITLLD
ncbi:phosphonate ABC transporter periplasmic phosphonate-binding protein [Vibrio orientalis CIP 102891 = ATCC 33934]|uniref:Periplasmic binding protein-related protein n=1 Tax=Vibrio orientalis CIP 102891 = ATCC 33934 TaxID=675816 RepID=C9QKS2_VIBOR|nr:phosphate/phosphite/phosphonate ABC transporter substrate-binding protein [Vibrio orientalis]EEX92407.1 periplasmic binding protein-related protein [Vibrio orientalis CIP 102891 = ATCC 33934]EGU48956.1 phosphonate ABC transporter periplasmic phosphonate-binding protein [Vibrio orientalis CIP 102891 = ATCC 33934]